ncbi:MBL fold metallo-hydrolase [Candidatus Roizmanbacteria bacterium]|jgi:competence protein ComEC|nr:MBL fold metallo-hydrolase [Candidatus Roizmanbacteria bacterium]
MNPESVNKKILLFSLFFSTLIIIATVFRVYDKKTKIVFCDVGQGDAAYIRIGNRYDILVDTGPDSKIVGCLGRHMPFYDRNIEVIIISHWQKDHFGGLDHVLRRYHIDQIFFSEYSLTRSFKKIKETLVKDKVIFDKIDDKTEIVIPPENRVVFYWPRSSYINLKDGNSYSSVFAFQEKSFKVLFTADAPGYLLNRLSRQYDLRTNVLKVPHHGSKNGLTGYFLGLAKPDLAVISVGKNNIYGHPAKEVLNLLKASKISIRRTDVEGDIVINLK